MNSRAVPITAFALAILVATAHAQEPAPQEGGFEIGMTLVTVDATARRLSLWVSPGAGAEYRGREGRVTLSIPPGIQILRGEPAFVAPLGERTGHHEFALQIMRPGRYEIRGRMQIGAVDSTADIAEVALPVTWRGDSIEIGDLASIRHETMLGERRARYAGDWIIPVGTHESPDMRDFARSGRRVRVIRGRYAKCGTCVVSGADTVRFVVVVGPSGEVTSARTVGAAHRPLPDSSTVAAARAALAGWKFQPASLRGVPLTDWMVVGIPIVRDSRRH